MSYIISKLDVDNLRTEIIYSSNSENDCKAKLLDFTQSNQCINKIVENDYIKSFHLDIGYLYNKKKLRHIYQILEIKKNASKEIKHNYQKLKSESHPQKNKQKK